MTLTYSSFITTVPENPTVMGQNCVGVKEPPKEKVVHIPFTLSEDSER